MGERKEEECQKNVLVMKCNKNVNIPCSEEYLSVDIEYCGAAGRVAKGKNIAITWLFKR